jgi:hypothetical protein
MVVGQTAIPNAFEIARVGSGTNVAFSFTVAAS